MSSSSAVAGIALSAALAGLLGLPVSQALAQTFGGAGGAGSSGAGGAGGGLNMPGGNAPAGSNGGGGGGGTGLANAASGTGQPGGAGNGTGGAGGAGGANGYDATAGAFDGTANYRGAIGVAGNSTGSNAGGGGGGAGGFGAVLQGSGSFGTIGQLSGGNGGDGGSSGVPGMATVAGSGAAGNGGAGAYLSGPLTFTVNPAGGAGGGAGGYGGSEFGAGVAGKSGNGGTGIYVTGGATLINQGAIGGGEGRYGGQGAGGSGGDGVYISGGTLINAVNATIGGGNGGVGQNGPVATGGNGVTVASPSHVMNSGGIYGGRGADGNDLGGNGGAGGIGAAFLASGGVLINAGATAGGEGGSAVTGAAQAGGGGIGVFGAGLTINNVGGTILGGTGGGAVAGGEGAGSGAGGIGIVGSNLTINNAGGAVAGGVSGDSTTQAYAIQLTGGTNYVGTGGTITGGINVLSGASFQPALPGSAVGTPLAINGPLVFAQTSTYSIRIAGGATDSVALNGVPPPVGTAVLHGAKVFVQGVAGRPAPRDGMRYTIVTAAGGVVGRFNPAVASNLAFLAPTLAYDPTHVYLRAQYDYAITAGLTQNQRNVAAALEAGSQKSPGAAPRLFNALNAVQTSQAPAVLDSLSGEGITAAQNIAQRSAELFTSSIFDQTTFYGSAANSITLTEPIRELADMPSRRVEPAVPTTPNRTWRAWATGFGGVDNIHGDGRLGSAYQQNTIYGGTLGVDYQLLPNYLVGVAVGGTNGDFLVPGRATSGSTTGGHVAIYDLATFGSFYGASSSSFSYFTNRTTRIVSGFGGLGNETERGSFDSHEFRSRLEFGRHVSGYGGVLTPFVALELAELRSNGFGEQAVQGPGLFRLNINGQSAASAPAFVGLRLQRVTSLGSGMVLSPTLQVAYVHEFAPYRSQFATIADLPGATFLVDGARPSRNAAQVKAGAELTIGSHAGIFANFDGELSGVNQLYAGKGGFRYWW